MKGCRGLSKDTRRALGVLFVVLGALLLFQQLNILTEVLRFWPVTLIAAGIIKLTERPESRRLSTESHAQENGYGTASL
jgi:hypothetical protein